MPNLFIIAGPNGAGKTTYARRFLGLRNLAEIYRPLIDHWRGFDNTGAVFSLIVEEEDRHLRIANASVLARIEHEANVRFVHATPPSRVEEPLVLTGAAETRIALRAMQKAFADAVLENLRFGLPVIQWIDGRVVETPAEELAPLARRILAANGELPDGE